MEEESIRDRLSRRVPPRWDGVTIGDGWLPLVDRLDRALAEIDPDYAIHQVKEKFGGLRYYCSLDGDARGAALILEAEEQAWRTCEVCGTTEGVTTDGASWIRTLCPEHMAGYQPRGSRT
jgi:hypothetical protein